MQVQRTLGLGNLKAGRYQVRVTVSGGGSNAVEMAWLTIVGR
jgi:hypothetical protein